MYQVIARKYRPQSFAEVIGQEHVRVTLENAIRQGRIAHGYILSGQRGTGKTTVARILARCLNCETGPAPAPCGVCSSCIAIAQGSSVDVIEIDAASNRGINEMRELREAVRYRPAQGRYKVFIIDEAHQITSEAFNALLKTLEEPPEWVVFILCTTESHKIPATIASRCQQFSFRSVEFADLVARMEWIAKQEGINADAETLSVLAQAGEGSVRDSLSALDQAIALCGTTLNAAEVRGMLGMFSLDSLGEVTRALEASDSKRMLEVAGDLESNGRSLQHFARELARYFRNLLVVKIAQGQSRLVSASAAEQARLVETAARFSEEDLTRYLRLTLDLFGELQSSLQPRLHLEIGLLRLVYAGRLQSIEEAIGALGGGSGSSVPKPPAAKVAPPKAPPVSPSRAQAEDLKSRLHSALMELGLAFTADGVEHSEIAEFESEVIFTAPKHYLMAMKTADLDRAIKQATGSSKKITVRAGEGAEPAQPAASIPEPAKQDEVSARAMAHPEVQRFQEIFPGSTVRATRNLKET